MPKVVVLGGGMGGMVAADELSQRGYEVTLYERWDRWGGKARSFSRYHSATEDRKGLPGEHGFRFFPGWYRHVPNSMRSTDTNNGTVYDNLAQASRVVIAQDHGQPRLEVPSRFPQSKAEWKLALQTFRDRDQFGLSDKEFKTFGMKMLDLMAQCKTRRDEKYMGITWWDYIEAEKMGSQYKKLLATGLTRSLVAMKAEVACTRTVGNILIQMLVYATIPGKASDRVLDGPTSDVWIKYWREKLQKQNVTLVDNSHVKALHMEGDRIKSAEVLCGEEVVQAEADFFVSAVPVEVMTKLVNDDIRRQAPSLANLQKLQVEWMNGIVFYLKRDVPITHGHCILADSTWAITAISQAQFWSCPMDDFGAGSTHGVLSTDISNWIEKGDQVVHKAAQDCSAEEIATECWAQIKAHFKELTDDDLIAPVDDPNIRSWFLDPDINTKVNEPGYTGSVNKVRGLMTIDKLHQMEAENADMGHDANAEPLLINTVNSWQNRPHSKTDIDNLVLASDYVRTNTDLATMEGANEAGRRAVNHILDADGSNKPRVQVYDFPEMWLFAPFRGLDKLLMVLGIPAINWHWLWHIGIWLMKGLMHVVARIARLFKLI